MKKAKKLKFKVELDNFYIDYDEMGNDSIEASLKNYIIKESVYKIQESIKEKVENEIVKQVSSMVQNQLNTRVQEIVSKVVLEDSIVTSTRDNTPVKLTDYIRNLFISNTGWRSPDEFIKQLAKKYGDEMKARYDMIFASQIVVRLNENNMLKEGIAEKLLTDNK